MSLQKESEWEYRFDELVESFDDWGEDSDGNEHYCPNPDWKKLKSFIRKTLAKLALTNLSNTKS